MIRVSAAIVTLILALVLLSSSARVQVVNPLAGCSGPAIIQDSTGVSRNYDLSLGTAGDCANQQVIVNTAAAPVQVAIAAIGSTQVTGDPCQIQTPTDAPISITAAATTSIIAGTAAKRTYICSIALATGAANNVAVIEGVGATCTTPAGIIGGTTAANGLNLAANQGLTFGNGLAYLMSAKTAANNVCLITSSAGPLAGVVKWVQQ